MFRLDMVIMPNTLNAYLITFIIIINVLLKLKNDIFEIDNLSI